MKFLDLEASVLVDGVELTEYDITYNEELKEATCWIPSEAGKTFTISAKALRMFTFDTIVYFHADGSPLGGHTNRKGILPERRVHQGVTTSATTLRPLSFTMIELTDDDAFLNSPTTKDLGNVVVELHQVVITEEAPCGYVPNLGAKIHEMSKKAMVHNINFGKEIVMPVKKFVDVKPIARLCKLIFRYRSIDVLRADGIAPLAPPPQRKRKASEENNEDEGDEGASETDNEDEDEAALKALLEQIHSLEDKISKKGPKRKKKVKMEPKSTFVPGEVIDLT